jgi:WD40 repeat protein
MSRYLHHKHFFRFGEAFLALIALRLGFNCIASCQAQTPRVTEVHGLIATRYHSGPMIFSPDGKTLALPKVEGGTVELWNVATGKVIVLASSFNKHRVRANHVAFSRDGRYLALDNQEGGITLWDLTLSKELFHISETLLSFVNDMAFTKDSQNLVTVMEKVADQDNQAGRSFTAVRWSVATGKRQGSQVFDNCHQFKAFSADGRYAVLQHKKGQSVFDLDSGNSPFAPAADGGFRFSEDGSVLVSYRGDGLSVWDVPSGAVLREFTFLGDNLPPGYEGLKNLIAVSADKKLLAVGGFKETHLVGLISLESGKLLSTFECGPPSMLCAFVCFSPVGRLLATDTASDDKKDRSVRPLLRLWRIPGSL